MFDLGRRGYETKKAGDSRVEIGKSSRSSHGRFRITEGGLGLGFGRKRGT